MNLEKQVTSLKLSKKLKELGVKQESLFWWVKDVDETSVGCGNIYILHQSQLNKDEETFNEKVLCSSYTVAELGEMLPVRDKKWQWDCRIERIYRNLVWTWEINFYSNDGTGYLLNEDIYDKNEANSRAKMLIYLIENNLLTI